MLISIIIPTCSRNDLLEKCLQKLSVCINQAQLDKNLEVLITDDSKNNNAKDLIKKSYSWATWIEGPKRGPAANRNNGAKKAKGEWLIFLDDDCEPDTNLVKSYADVISKAGEIDVIEGLIYSDKIIKPNFIAPVNLTGGFLWSCNFAIKKGVFDKVGGFDENYKYPNLEDVDLHRRLRLNFCTISFNKEAKVYHPPRLIASPKKMALYHESWFYYHAKFGDKKTVFQLLKVITRNRLVKLWRNPKNEYSIIAIWNWILEIGYTVFYSRRWRI